jgi:hypothetical protein
MNLFSYKIIVAHVTLDGVMAIVIGIAPKFRAFKPGRQRWIFKGDKTRTTSSFEGEVKP